MLLIVAFHQDLHYYTIDLQRMKKQSVSEAITCDPSTYTMGLTLYQTLSKRPLVYNWLTLYLLVSSADDFCKQFGPRSGLT